MQEEYLKNWDENKVYDEAVKEEIEKRFSFVYPYKYLEDIPVKVSVSDLKKRSWHDESELEENISVSAEEAGGRTGSAGSAFMAEKQEEYKGGCQRYCLSQSNGMSGLCRSRYRGTASGSVKETSGEPEK